MMDGGDTSRPMSPQQIRQLKALLRERREHYEEAQPLYAEFRRTLAKRGWSAHATIHNVLEFVALYGYDYSCLLDDVVDHQGKLRGMLYARLLVLVIFETSQKLRHLLGGQFQSDLRSVGYTEEEIKVIRRIHKCFMSTFEQCRERYGDVRNGVVAHRDDSAEKQLELIEKTDVQSVADLAIEMEKCMSQLHALLAVHLRRLKLSVTQNG